MLLLLRSHRLPPPRAPPVVLLLLLRLAPSSRGPLPLGALASSWPPVREGWINRDSTTSNDGEHGLSQADFFSCT